jgi:hypothetical protein
MCFRNSAGGSTYLLWQELLRKWLRMLVGFGAARKTLPIVQGSEVLSTISRELSCQHAGRRSTLWLCCRIIDASHSPAFAKPSRTRPQRGAFSRVPTNRCMRMAEYCYGAGIVSYGPLLEGKQNARSNLWTDATRRSGCLMRRHR